MGRLVHYDTTAVETDAMRYLRAHPFLEQLKKHEKDLDRQQFKTLRGVALSGDVQAAEKGLRTILNR